MSYLEVTWPAENGNNTTVPGYFCFWARWETILTLLPWWKSREGFMVYYHFTFAGELEGRWTDRWIQVLKWFLLATVTMIIAFSCKESEFQIKQVNFCDILWSGLRSTGVSSRPRDYHPETQIGEAWPAQSVEHVTLDLRVVSSSHMLGMEPTLKKGEGGTERHPVILFLFILHIGIGHLLVPQSLGQPLSARLGSI